MTITRRPQGTIFLCFGAFLALAGMGIDAQVGSAYGSPFNATAAGDTGPQIASKTKQALLVIFPYFSETIFPEMRGVLESKGIKIVIASSTLDPVAGHEKMQITPDVSLAQVHIAKYDAIVFIQGYRYPGDNAEAIRIAKECAAEGKVLGAIGMAINTLIKADLLKGKKVAGKSVSDFWIQKAEATVSDAPVERDGNIVTAAGKGAAKEFAEAIAEALNAGAN
jgi:putative intracellular protease/amidase